MNSRSDGDLSTIPRSHLKSLVGEGARIVNAMCYPSQFGCTDEGVPRYAYDPVKAKQLLAEAGFPNGFDVDLNAYRDRAHTEAIISYLRCRHKTASGTAMLAVDNSPCLRPFQFFDPTGAR